MKAKKLLKELDEFELEQMLHAYNTICKIIKENDKNRQDNEMYIDALCNSQIIFNEIIKKEQEKISTLQ